MSWVFITTTSKVVYIAGKTIILQQMSIIISYYYRLKRDIKPKLFHYLPLLSMFCLYGSQVKQFPPTT